MLTLHHISSFDNNRKTKPEKQTWNSFNRPNQSIYLLNVNIDFDAFFKGHLCMRPFKFPCYSLLTLHNSPQFLVSSRWFTLISSVIYKTISFRSSHSHIAGYLLVSLTGPEIEWSRIISIKYQQLSSSSGSLCVVWLHK